jgi:hypothetical protein
MYLTSLYYASLAANQDIRELAPVFLVVINYERDLWILSDIAQTLQLAGGSSLGLFIDGRVEILVVEYEADRNDMRLSGAISSGEMGETGRAN